MNKLNLNEDVFLEKILENLEFYKASFELSQEAKLVLDGETCEINRVNKATLDLLKSQPEDIIGKSIFQFVIELREQEELDCFDNINTDAVLLIPDGDSKIINITFDQFYRNGKKLIIVSIRDISNIVNDRLWLKIKSEALDVAHNPVLITNVHGDIVWMNNAFSKKSGYSLKEVINKKPSIFKSGKHSQEFYKNMWDTILSGKTWQGTVCNITKDGDEYNTILTITPIRALSDKITHFIAIRNIDQTELDY